MGSYAIFKSIQAQLIYTAYDGFCGKEGKIIDSLTQSKWEISFALVDDICTVELIITYDDLAQWKKILEMGFKKGFTMGLNQLEKLLKAL